MNPDFSYSKAAPYIDRQKYPLKESVMWSRLHRAKKNGTLALVRKGVYLPSDIQNKFVIGCNAVADGILVYHSALEYHLLQTQEFNELYISSSVAFRSFVYNGEMYSYKKHKFTLNPLIIDNESDYSIRVTSLEQTLIDCIYNINLGGGLEEVMYALAECPADKLSESAILECLELYGNKSLWQRAGYLFGMMNRHFQFSESFFEKCKSKIGKNQSYLINPFFCNAFDKEWNLCIPSNISTQLKAI